MLQSIGITEWLLIVLIIVLLFGGNKIPKLFKSIEKSVKGFKKSTGSEEKK
jgi:sec-independent protein translocase protein TatA